MGMGIDQTGQNGDISIMNTSLALCTIVILAELGRIVDRAQACDSAIGNRNHSVANRWSVDRKDPIGGHANIGRSCH
jgi:hypothetical protein